MLTFNVRRAYYETCSEFNNNPQKGKLGFIIKINYMLLRNANILNP
jgi:hypothetical protein